MPAIKATTFDGIYPRTSPTMLADNQAQVAQNVKLYSQELRYWNGPTSVQSLTIIPKTIYKLYDVANINPAIWLTWTNVVDVAPGPLGDTVDSRVYYTGDPTPRKTNYALATSGAAPYPFNYYELGVPAPTGAPTVTATVAGTGIAETRAYVYTYIHQFGALMEESAPSPAASVTVNTVGSTVTINGFTTPPAGKYNWLSRRIYRSVTGGTTTSYQFVAEIPLATTSYADTLTVAGLGVVLPSLGWLPPPTGLQGIVSMANGSGALCGFVGNTVYFSEPFYAHAWPLKYAMTVPYPIIGLQIFGTTVVVMTDRNPYLINGGTPGIMSLERLPMVEPCVSKGSIVTDESGVTYASPNGLVTIGYSVRAVVTTSLFTRDEWQALTPGQIKATVLNGRYFGVYPDQSNSNKAFIINTRDRPAMSNITMPASAVYVDSKTASVFYAHQTDKNIYQLDADTANPLTYEWRSKRWQLPHATTFSVMRVDADYTSFTDVTAYNANAAAIIAANQALFAGNLKGAFDSVPMNTYTFNGSVMTNNPSFATTRNITVIILADDVPVASIQPTSFDPIRMPPFKARTLEIKILGNANVRSVVVATHVSELD